jgi:hypothetical protein
MRRFKTEYPHVPALVTSKALTTKNVIPILHLFRETVARVLKPKDRIADYLYIEHSRPGAALRRGADAVLTDRVVHELALIAHKRVGSLAPREATSMEYHPLSQEALLELVGRPAD